MSLLAMDTSMFDVFAFDPPELQPDPMPEPRFREKLEIKPARHQEQQSKVAVIEKRPEFKGREVMDIKVRQQESLDVKPRQQDLAAKVQMLDSPSPRTPQGGSDMQSVRQKLRESLTSALEMVVSKHLVKSVLGVVKEAKKDFGEGESPPKVRSARAGPVQEGGSPQVNDDSALVVDLGLLDSDAMNFDPSGADEPSLEDFPSVGGEKRANPEEAASVDFISVRESPVKRLKTEFHHSDVVQRKLELEEKEGRIGADDVKGGLQLMDQAKRIALDVEGELFKLYGFKKTYNQKARSLLFNLKDKSNPELRARVFAGEITPADLCRMSAEQLASKELSDWRNAKEQALDKWVVLTDADLDPSKVVKKTHKGEFVVNVQNENSVDINPLASQSVFPVTKVEREDKLEGEASDLLDAVVDDHVDTTSQDAGKEEVIESPSTLKLRRSEERTHGEQTGTTSSKPEIHMLDNSPVSTDSEAVEVDANLPTIMSLDEYLDAREDDGGQEDVFEDAPIEPRVSVPERLETVGAIVPSKAPSKVSEENSASNRGRSPRVKGAEKSSGLLKSVSDSEKRKVEEVEGLWEGQFHLSSNRQSPLEIVYRSGEKVEIKKWPETLEVKGRVRLAHLAKFLQDLQQSRSRAVTVVDLFLQEGLSDYKALVHHVKEVASQYQMGDRVGFVEPGSGYELYLLPPGSGTSKLLNEHGHPEVPEARGRDVALVGVIVWRRSHSSSRLPDRNNNVKRHAVASSTHHESPSKHSPTGVVFGKDPGSDLTPSVRGGTSTIVSSALSSMHLSTKFQVESPTKEDHPPLSNWPVQTNHLSSPPQVAHTASLASKYVPDSSDLPPGFTTSVLPSQSPPVATNSLPKQATDEVPPGFWPRPAQRSSTEEDDDLPEFEFDFSSQGVGGGRPPPMRNFPASGPHPDNPPNPSSQFQPHRSVSGMQELRTPPAPVPDYVPTGFPPRPAAVAPPPPSQDHAFLPRNPPQFFHAVGPAAPVGPIASVSVNGLAREFGNERVQNEFRPFSHGPGVGQVMLAQPGASPQSSIAQYGDVNSMKVGHGAPPPSHIARNDLPEWRPSAQFESRPPLYESDSRPMGGVPPPLPLQQEMNWGAPQQPQFPQSNFKVGPANPPQWQHSNQFQQQQQQRLPIRQADARDPYAWDPTRRGPENSGLVDRSREQDTRNGGDDRARAKDPRVSELSWQDRDGGRQEFRRR